MTQKKQSFVSILQENQIILTPTQIEEISKKTKHSGPSIHDWIHGNRLDDFKIGLYGMQKLLKAGIIEKEDIFNWIIAVYSEENFTFTHSYAKFCLISLMSENVIFLAKHHSHLKIKEKIINAFRSDSYNETLEFIKLSDEQFSQIALLKDKKIFAKFLTEAPSINNLYKSKVLNEEQVFQWITKGYKNILFFWVQSKYEKIAKNAELFIELAPYKFLEMEDIFARAFMGNGKILELEITKLLNDRAIDAKSFFEEATSDHIIEEAEAVLNIGELYQKYDAA